MTENEGFDELYGSTREDLVRQLYALTGDVGTARDLVQEAFIRAWARWDKVGGYDRPEAWVRKVAYRLAVDGWRRDRRTVLRADVATAPRPGPGEGELLAALLELPKREREAIVLHHIAGLSVEETAAELKAPVGTVKSWLFRGREHLACLLGDSGVETTKGVVAGG